MAKPNVIDCEELIKTNGHHTVLYINYDNEAFQNTGIQESGSTPFGASTTTGPGGKSIKGKVGVKQDILNPFAFLGHKSAFLATASIAYPLDFMGKVIEAMKTPGGGFIQIFAPCPRGWRHAAEKTLEVAKLAVDSGYWPLITIRVKDGVPKYSYSRPLKFDREKVEKLIKIQGKFAHLFKPEFLEDKLNEIILQSESRFQNINNLVEKFGAESPMDVYKFPLKSIPDQHLIAPGHGLCPGCGAGSVLNQLTSAAYSVAKENVLFVNNTCCVEVSTSKDNLTSWHASWMHQLFESGATVADAISVAYRARKAKGDWKGDIPYVIHIGGDGSTYDIGYQFLKSALVRSCSYNIQSEFLKME
jgi:pyruvate/2-oxoacid:ferredoxin oxidoreductase beta subunit